MSINVFVLMPPKNKFLILSNFLKLFRFQGELENIRHKWYNDRTACVVFIHGVFMITLYDAGRSTTKKNYDFCYLPSLNHEVNRAE